MPARDVLGIPAGVEHQTEVLGERIWLARLHRLSKLVDPTHLGVMLLAKLGDAQVVLGPGLRQPVLA